MKTIYEIRKYWESPDDGKNAPEFYFGGIQKSALICDTISELKLYNPSILEVGCNVGRNLACLYVCGYDKVNGVELSEKAVELGKNRFPFIKIENDEAEKYLGRLRGNSSDVVFTMAVLEHIHPENEGVFNQMARVAKKYVITIEDEAFTSWRHFPRNYKTVFEPLGYRQTKVMNCANIKGLGRNFNLRVFEKI